MARPNYLIDVMNYLSGDIDKEKFISLFSIRCNLAVETSNKRGYDIEELKNCYTGAEDHAYVESYAENLKMIAALHEIAYSKNRDSKEVIGESSFAKGYYIKNGVAAHLAILMMSSIARTDVGREAICDFYEANKIKIDDCNQGKYFSCNFDNDVNDSCPSYHEYLDKKEKQLISPCVVMYSRGDNAK